VFLWAEAWWQQGAHTSLASHAPLNPGCGRSCSPGPLRDPIRTLARGLEASELRVNSLHLGTLHRLLLLLQVNKDLRPTCVKPWELLGEEDGAQLLDDVVLLQESVKSHCHSKPKGCVPYQRSEACFLRWATHTRARLDLGLHGSQEPQQREQHRRNMRGIAE